MECRVGCGACCIIPSISSAIPGMPEGKKQGIRCVQLTKDNKCKLFGVETRPKVCSSLKASKELCGLCYEDAANYLNYLEVATSPRLIRK